MYVYHVPEPRFDGQLTRVAIESEEDPILHQN